MKVLAIFHLREGVSPTEFAPHQHDELRRAWQLFSDGIVREISLRGDGGGIIATMETETLEQARAALDSLPLVHLDMLDYDLIPLKPFVGFQALFAPEAAQADRAA